MVTFGDIWCTIAPMSRKKPKRFTVTLPVETYKRLKSLAESQDPSLTLQYLLLYAVNDLLTKAEDPQLDLDLGVPKGT